MADRNTQILLNNYLVNPIKMARGVASQHVEQLRWRFLTFPFIVTIPGGGAPPGTVTFTQPTHRSIPFTHRCKLVSVTARLNFPCLTNPEMADAIQFTMAEMGRDFVMHDDPLPISLFYTGTTQQPGKLRTIAGYVLEPNSDLQVTISHNTNITLVAGLAGTYSGMVVFEADLMVV